MGIVPRRGCRFGAVDRIARLAAKIAGNADAPGKASVALPETNGVWKMDVGKIFVQVPSYRDPQLIPTLLDLIDHAENPQGLRVVVCWQHDADESLNDFVFAGFHLDRGEQQPEDIVHVLGRKGARVELIDIHFLRAKGCGWARHAAQKRYRGERYNLQIDSHHRFSPGWDTAMIAMLETLRGESDRPLLTGYPPSFEPGSYPQGRQSHVGQMLVSDFSPLGIVSYKAVKMHDWRERTKPMRARFISGGFVFSDGSFVDEVMTDEDQFFSTEEIVMAVRAYTHGYDLFHPHRALLWHQYNSGARKVWEDHTEERKSSGEIERSAMDRSIAALEKSLALLGICHAPGTQEGGRQGLGQRRSVSRYERYAGLSFKHRGIRVEALGPTEPDESHADLPDEVWEAGLVCRRSYLVRIAQSEATQSRSRPDALKVVAYCKGGRAVAHRQLSADELGALVRDGCFDYVDQYVSAPSGLPDTYALSVSGGVEESGSGFSIIVQEAQGS